jgi:tetratricopeptide (TPR) repeat protein
MSVTQSPPGRANAAPDAWQLINAGRWDEAEVLGRRAVRGSTSLNCGHGLLVMALLGKGRWQQAQDQFLQAAGLPGGDGDAFDCLAFAAMRLGRHEEARSLYLHAVRAAPSEARLYYNLACSQRNLGDLAAAEASCDRCIELDVRQYQAWLMRSELRVHTQQHNHVRELQQALAAGAGDFRCEVFLGYALGKELDELGRYDEAYATFAAAAQRRRGRLSYDVHTDEHKLRRIADCYPPGKSRRDDVDSSRYIFVVGLPRSGTTLTERILTGLAGVRSNGETDNFSQALLAASAGAGDVFSRAAAANQQAVAEGYAQRADPARQPGRIVEKLPHNSLYVGAIHRALPQARIILVRRPAADSCFAMFRTLFASGYPFSYDLVELARYFAAHERLMQHWRGSLGEALYEVSYDELVRAPTVYGPNLAEYCKLSWDERALQVENNATASLTASAAQVRRPIYGTSSGRWRHYQSHLAPLLAALREQGLFDAN